MDEVVRVKSCVIHFNFSFMFLFIYLCIFHNLEYLFLGDERCFELATGGTPSTTRKEYWENGTIPWLSSGEVHKKFIYETDNFITEKR